MLNTGIFLIKWNLINTHSNLLIKFPERKRKNKMLGVYSKLQWMIKEIHQLCLCIKKNTWNSFFGNVQN